MLKAERCRLQGGFSLLEMLVAMAILGVALGALYQAASGATRNVRADERYAYAVELARSLLAANATVPAAGVNASGDTDSGFRWRVLAQPLEYKRTSLSQGALQSIEVGVSWQDGLRQREVLLHSVVVGAANAR